MKSTKVCIVVKKEAISLSETGFNVTIISGAEEGCPTEETLWPIANTSAQHSLLD